MYYGSEFITDTSCQYNYTYCFQCSGVYCQPGTADVSQPLEITSSVSFIDVSKPAEAASAPNKKSTATLPSDFFYPLE